MFQPKKKWPPEVRGDVGMTGRLTFEDVLCVGAQKMTSPGLCVVYLPIVRPIAVNSLKNCILIVIVLKKWP